MTKEVDQLFQNQSKDNDSMSTAMDLLAAFRPGKTLLIRRLRPTWCSGFLERVECLEGDQIDIDYILRKWGGKVLGLRLLDENGKLAGGTDLNLSSYPPRHEGRLCNPNDDCRTVEDTPRQPTSATNVIQNPTDPIKLMKFLQEQRAQDMAEFRSMLGQSTVGQNIAAQSPLAQLVELGKTYKQLQGIFGGAPVVSAVPVSENQDVNIMGQITDLLRVLKSPSETSPRARILPQKPTPPTPNPGQPPQGQNLASILANMDESQYTNLLLTSLQAMPENKRAAIIEHFLNVSGIMEGEPDESDDPDDIEDEDTGGTSGHDETDDPVDREGD